MWVGWDWPMINLLFWKERVSWKKWHFKCGENLCRRGIFHRHKECSKGWWYEGQLNKIRGWLFSTLNFQNFKDKGTAQRWRIDWRRWSFCPWNSGSHGSCRDKNCVSKWQRLVRNTPAGLWLGGVAVNWSQWD